MGAGDDADTFCAPRDHLDLDKNWKLRAEIELNETPEKARENLKILAKKLSEDKTVYSRTDQSFLMAFLRGRKHNVDNAYKLIKCYYEMKHSYPEFYNECLPSEKGYLYEMGFLNLMPGEDKNGCNLAVLIPGKIDFSRLRLEELFQMGASIFESALLNPEIQIAGICIIIDMNDMTLYQQAKLVNVRCAWQVTNCIQEKIPVRIRAIHIINQPIYFNALYAIFKPFLKRKLRKRIHFHGSNMSSLHQHISPKYLPPEWGGEGPEYTTEPITKVVKNNEANLIDWRKYGIKKPRPPNEENK